MTTEQRFKRLERENVRMKATVAGMTVVLAVVLLVGAGPNQDKTNVLEEVRAKRFVVINEAGEIRGSLSDTMRGPKLVLMDLKGKKRVALTATKTTGLVTWDKNGRKRVGMGLTPDGVGLVITYFPQNRIGVFP